MQQVDFLPMYRYATPMAYSMEQAADATGRTKPAILRVIQTGKISARKNEMGEWEIDPAELRRIYSPVAQSVTPTVTPNAEETVELLLLRQELTAKGSGSLHFRRNGGVSGGNSPTRATNKHTRRRRYLQQ